MFQCMFVVVFIIFVFIFFILFKLNYVRRAILNLVAVAEGRWKNQQRDVSAIFC